jgi:hypothetical protein
MNRQTQMKLTVHIDQLIEAVRRNLVLHLKRKCSSGKIRKTTKKKRVSQMRKLYSKNKSRTLI